MLKNSARYRITHQTRYTYSEPVAICENQLRMQPQTRSRLICHKTEIAILPNPDSVFEHTDYYGNRVFSFAIESLHKELQVAVKSDVTVTAKELPVEKSTLSWMDLRESLGQPVMTTPAVKEFLYDSPRVQKGADYVAYALVSFTDRRGVVEAALDLTRRVHADFKYDATATDVNTPTAKAFQIRAGVCQDFAHIQIACLRSIGLPARYVSGYLRTVTPDGKSRLVGADETHAWLSLYAGEQLGWIDCDPTNACLTGVNHIPICVGRDYDDVSPMRGVVLGGGDTMLKVSVDVEPVDC